MALTGRVDDVSFFDASPRLFVVGKTGLVAPSKPWHLTPSENWNQENMSKYEFIGIKRHWSEDFQCESEKATRLQRTSDNF